MKTFNITLIIAGILFLSASQQCKSQTTDFMLIPELSGTGYLEKSPDGNLITIVSNTEIAKINLEGDIIWSTTINTEEEPFLSDILVTDDGSSYICLNVIKGEAPNRIKCPGILHLSADGDSLWFKSPIINDSTTNPFVWGDNLGITQTQNGNLFTTGNLLDNSDKSYYMVSKLSSNGELLAIYTDSLDNLNFNGYGSDILEIDGSIYTGGATTYHTSTPRISSFLVKLDTDLNPIFFNHYIDDTSINQQYTKSLLNFNGGIMFQNLVNRDDANQYTEFRHVNYDGSENYRQALGNNFESWSMDGLNGLEITPVSDGGFLYSGWTNQYPSNNYYGIVARYSSNGNIQWINVIGDTTNNYNYYATDAVELNDGRIAITGIYENEEFERQAFLIITDSNGNGNFPGFNVLDDEEETLSQFEVFPNPAKNNIHISTGTNKTCNYRIIGLDGKVLKSGIIQGSTKLDVSKISKGIVLFLMEGYQPKKLVIQ